MWMDQQEVGFTWTLRSREWRHIPPLYLYTRLGKHPSPRGCDITQQASRATTVARQAVNTMTTTRKRAVFPLSGWRFIRELHCLRRELKCSSRRSQLYQVHGSDYRISNCDNADGSNCEIVNCISVRASGINSLDPRRREVICRVTYT
jgi:hypothetical protein